MFESSLEALKSRSFKVKMIQSLCLEKFLPELKTSLNFYQLFLRHNQIRTAEFIVADCSSILVAL